MLGYIRQVPETVANTSVYQLRDTENVSPSLTRTQLYYKSFLPSSIRNWNELPLNPLLTRTQLNYIFFYHQALEIGTNFPLIFIILLHLLVLNDTKQG